MHRICVPEKEERPMDFRDLSYVSAIAKYQSISKAAAALYISQPTLSKFLKNLEYQLNVSLFERINNKYVLTFAGERYLSYAERILDLKGNLDRELDDIVSANNETLRIGFSSIRGSDFILGIVPRFTALHPNVHLQLSEVNYTTFENTLLSGQLDIVLFNLPIKNPGIEYQILAYDEIVLVAPSNHPIVSMAEKREECNYPWVDLRWLQDEQFIMVSKELRLHAIVESLFEQAGFTPKIHFYTRNLEAASMLVAEGYGLTFTNIKYISHLTFKHQPAFFSIGSPSTFRTFVAGYRKNAYLSPAAQDIIRLSKNI